DQFSDAWLDLNKLTFFGFETQRATQAGQIERVRGAAPSQLTLHMSTAAFDALWKLELIEVAADIGNLRLGFQARRWVDTPCLPHAVEAQRAIRTAQLQ